MNLFDYLAQNFPASWRQGTSLDRAWFHVGALKVEVNRTPHTMLFAVSIKTNQGRAVGEWAGGDLLTLGDRLAQRTAEAVLRALETGPALTPADVPMWARHATLKALRRPCAIPRAQAWQHRINDLADALTPKES